jgi:hypothetical protein
MLLPVLDQFVAASAGDVDVDWWRGFIRTKVPAAALTSRHVRAFFP